MRNVLVIVFLFRLSPVFAQYSVFPPPVVRSSDVIWAKEVLRCVEIDPLAGNAAWLKLIRQALISDSVNVYLNDLLKEKISKGSALNSLKQLEGEKEFDSQNNHAHARYFWISETWFFDKQRSVLDCRITAIAPVRQSTEPEVFYPGFWFRLEELRGFIYSADPSFAKGYAFDKVFLKRNFSGQIIKESNLNDDFIFDYASGEDALHESQRISNQITGFDKKLWKH